MLIILPESIITSMNEVIDASKKHWKVYYRKRRKILYDIRLWLLAHYDKENIKVKDYPVGIFIDWYCKDRRKDPDNIASSKKVILDALRLYGILKGDEWKYINQFGDRFFYDKDNPRIEITIKERNTLQEGLSLQITTETSISSEEDTSNSN